MIEPCWPWLKKSTTLRGAPADKKTAKSAWLRAWDNLPQRQIQKWIERIPRQIQEVIRLEGGNEYKEGRTGKETRKWKGLRIKGKLSKRAFLQEGDVNIDDGLDDGLDDRLDDGLDIWLDMF